MTTAEALVENLARVSMWGGAFAVVVWTVIRLLPRLSATTRCALWWLVALKLVIGLVWSSAIALPVLPASAPTLVTPSLDSAAQTGPVPATTTPMARAEPSPYTRPSWPMVVAGIWAAVSALLLGRSARQARQVAALIQQATPAPPALRAMADELSAVLGLGRCVDVRVSADVDTPLVGGMLRPVVLLPSRGFEALAPAQQRMAVCHELVHLRRADLWWHAIPALAERLFFFHPLAYVAAREYLLAREVACDAAVLRTLNAAPRDYGQLLLALGVTCQPRHLAAAGAPRTLSSLRRRITMLNQPSSTRAWRLVSCGLAAVAVFAVVPIRLVARPSSPATDATAQARAVVRPVSAAVPEFRTLPSPAPRPGPERSSSEDLTYVLFNSNGSATMSGSLDDYERVKRLYKSGARLLWFRLGSREYVVRDAAVARQMDVLFQPMKALDEEESGIEGKQDAASELQDGIEQQRDDIGDQLDELGTMQGRLGSDQADLAARTVELERERQRGKDVSASMRDVNQEQLDGKRQMEELHRRMDQLSEARDKLEQPLAEVSRQMDLLSKELETFSLRKELAKAKTDASVRLLFDRAIGSGAAVPVK